MRMRYLSLALAAGVLLLGACDSTPEGGANANGGANTAGAANTAATPDTPYATGPLPANGYKAQLTPVDPPARMRAGQKQTIQVRVRNASDVAWKVRGGEQSNKYYIAVGNRWFEADGQKLVTNLDGRHGLPQNLKPGEEVEVPLQITAPKNPGEYVLDLDLVQEQVTWFFEKGSETAKVKVSVVR